jgi:hypothetical protein
MLTGFPVFVNTWISHRRSTAILLSMLFIYSPEFIESGFVEIMFWIPLELCKSINQYVSDVNTNTNQTTITKRKVPHVYDAIGRDV